MPPKQRRQRRHPAEPKRVRRQIALSVLPPVLAAASISLVLWLFYFFPGPRPALVDVVGLIAGATLVAVWGAAIAMCFMRAMRRRWRAALLFPVAIAGGVVSLGAAFQEFALVEHGVDVECEVTAVSHFDRYDADAEELEPKSTHEFRCPGWEAVPLETDRADRMAVGDSRIVVFDPYGRIDPEFGDPTMRDGLLFVLLSLILFAAAAVIRILIVDDGAVVAAVGRVLGTLKRMLD
jgi:hypothetical protein